jgi:hypothetical protein
LPSQQLRGGSHGEEAIALSVASTALLSAHRLGG